MTEWCCISREGFYRIELVPPYSFTQERCTDEFTFYRLEEREPEVQASDYHQGGESDAPDSDGQYPNTEGSTLELLLVSGVGRWIFLMTLSRRAEETGSSRVFNTGCRTLSKDRVECFKWIGIGWWYGGFAFNGSYFKLHAHIFNRTRCTVERGRKHFVVERSRKWGETRTEPPGEELVKDVNFL
ncbi:hypothetical protein F5141DRAFT_1063635 [Pisolithus sp. B1]|nr:hypothetical protein F5141DRAFT_1063635 [Pisolithus sp. B1]